MSLAERMNGLKSGKGIEFMSEREKGEVKSILDKDVTIIDFDFITDKKTKDEYSVFIIEEIKDEFFCGGSVLTNWLKGFSDEDKAELQEKGAKVRFEERKSKESGRKYVAVVPVETDELPF